MQSLKGRSSSRGFNEAAAFQLRNPRSHQRDTVSHNSFNEAAAFQLRNLFVERAVDFLALASMRPQRFSCGIAISRRMTPRVYCGFNEAAAFQLRNQ